MWTALRSSLVNERFMVGKDFSFNDPQFTYNSPTDLFLRQLSKQSNPKLSKYHFTAVRC